MNQVEDEILIDQILQGEHLLFEKLVDKHKSYAYTIALNILKNKEDAEEVAHDSFLKAYKNLASFNKQSKFSTWFYRIVFNTSITHQRKRKVKKEDLQLIEYSYGAHAKAELEIEDQKHYINQGLDRLSEADRLIISLFYLKELSIEEIGEITNIQGNTIKVKLHRARKRLAQEMKNILKEEALNL